jgi:amidase
VSGVSQPHELTVLEQAAAIRSRQLRATELVAHYLARIEAHDRRLGGFVTVTAEPALAAARAVDAQADREPDRLPPLAGVPVAIKDLTLTRGVPTSFGSAVFARFVPGQDADVVTALRAAGTVSLGKTATSEFGAALYCETALGPPVRNPWRTDHTAGGSSGGAAAAVAAGLVSAAQGNDGGGSVRIPAAICGLVGFKPSRGVVSGGPLGFGGFGLPTDGPLARTVADAAAMLDAMAVPVPGQPHLPPPAPPGGYLAAARRGEPGRRRIGRWTGPVLADVELDPACRAAVDAAADRLARAGHELVEVAPPVRPDAVPLFETLWQALSLASPVPPEQEPRLLPLTRWLREQGRQVTVPRLLAVLAELQGLVRAAARELAGVDLLLSPVLAAPGAPVGWFTETGDPAEDFARQKRFSPYCAVYNLTGQPAVSLPAGRTAGGEPVGVMLAAAPGADGLLLQVAAQLEQAAPWSGRHPAVWSEPGSATVNEV